MADSFKDHFSTQSADYSKFRPTYPQTLFKWLAEQSPNLDTAWDGATGNGQTACQLARYFKRVIATDASSSQIANAMPHEGVEYRVALCEDSGIAANSIDLISVAQAAHWFDMDRFNREVARLLKPQGIVALWCYGLVEINPQIDELIHHLYENILGSDYWPKERTLLEQGYRTLSFPYDELQAPSFIMHLDWSLDQLLGYLGTWSAVQRYKEGAGEDPLLLIASDLERAWSQGNAVKKINWPLCMRVGRSS